MAEPLEKRVESAIENAERRRLLLQMAARLPGSLEEAADALGCSVPELVEILNDPEFQKTVKALRTLKTIGKLSSDSKAGRAVRKSFEQLRQQAGGSQLGNLFEIKDDAGPDN